MARELYAQCLTLDASSAAIARDPDDRRLRCRAWSLSVSFWRDRGLARRAFTLAERAARRWPELALVHSGLGGCYADLGRFVDAEAAYRRSFALHARPETLSLVAHALRKQGRRAESTECLHAVLRLDPSYEEAHYNLGCDLRLQGRHLEAIKRFEQAIAIDPDYAIAHAELGYAILLWTREADGTISVTAAERALVHLRRSVELDPSYYWSRIYLAIGSWELARLRVARAEYAAAVRLRPLDGFVLSTSARVQLLLADRLGHERALEVLESAGT